jgi:hypothetical protein
MSAGPRFILDGVGTVGVDFATMADWNAFNRLDLGAKKSELVRMGADQSHVESWAKRCVELFGPSGAWRRDAKSSAAPKTSPAPKLNKSPAPVAVAVTKKLEIEVMSRKKEETKNVVTGTMAMAFAALPQGNEQRNVSIAIIDKVLSDPYLDLDKSDRAGLTSARDALERANDPLVRAASYDSESSAIGEERGRQMAHAMGFEDGHGVGVNKYGEMQFGAMLPHEARAQLALRQKSGTSGPSFISKEAEANYRANTRGGR